MRRVLLALALAAVLGCSPAAPDPPPEVAARLRTTPTPTAPPPVATSTRGILGLNAPPGLVVGPAPPTRSTLALRWRDTSTIETGFSVERRSGDGAYAEIARVPPGTTRYEDSGLPPQTTYTYRVRAFGFGGESPYSNVDTGTTSP